MFSHDMGTGIYKFRNNTYPWHIRRRSNLGDIFWGKKKCVIWVGKYSTSVGYLRLRPKFPVHNVRFKVNGILFNTLRTGDADLRLYAYKQFKYPVPNVLTLLWLIHSERVIS
jgi:hypothetical protein